MLNISQMSRHITKPTKWPLRPVKTHIRPVWSESSLSTWRNIGPLTTYRAHNEDSDQTAQADLSLRWAHSHFVGFVVKKHWALNYILSARWRLWSDWADAQVTRVFAGRTVILLVLSWRNIGPLTTYWAHSDQTGLMPRLIWVFAGRICHFVGLVVRWLKFNVIMWTSSSKI